MVMSIEVNGRTTSAMVEVYTNGEKQTLFTKAIGKKIDEVALEFSALSVRMKNKLISTQAPGKMINDMQVMFLIPVTPSKGYGKNWYSENEIYEGEWCDGKRSGWGRMYYADGSIYEGQWFNDKRHGDGMLRLAKENRFEGQWLNDKKNGRGKYFFLNTGQLMEGVWCDDVPKTSQIVDLGREVARNSTESEIPEIKLKDPNGVLRETQEKLMEIINSKTMMNS
ncbi:unnamed protein product [Heterobilharzia americana]|nr:unnamed protein product [Heterobilharzia americana]